MKNFLNLFLILVITIFQISFFSFLNYPLNNLNVILTTIVFITIILNYRLGLYSAVLAGIVLDLYSVNGLGPVIITLLVVVLSLNFLFNNFFTNRSFYSLLVLGFIGTVIYDVVLLFLKYIFYSLKINGLIPNLDRFWFYNFSWQIILNLVLISLIFLIFNALSKKLKSVFLVR